MIEDKLDHLAATFVLEGDRTRARLEDSFAQTVRGLRIDGALARPFRPNAENYSGAGRLVGWSLRAVTADVTITFRDGRGVDSDPIATVVVAAGKSDNNSMPGAGVAFVDALYAEVTTAGGTIVGATWLGGPD
jgi:hypothetical protein